ncbi:MAG: hypothetical protein ACOC1K_04565 [Nanoarchaeota archaeon]
MREFIILLVVFGLIASAIVFGPNLYQHFGTRYESAQQHVRENNYSYIRGKIEHLQRLQLEYETADNEAHKQAIREMIKVEVTSFDKDHMPENLRQFVQSL